MKIVNCYILKNVRESECIFLKRFKKKKRSNNNILPINYLNFTNKLSAEWFNVKILRVKERAVARKRSAHKHPTSFFDSLKLKFCNKIFFPSLRQRRRFVEGKREGNREKVGGVTRGNANEGGRCGGGRRCRVTQPDAMADSWLTDGWKVLVPVLSMRNDRR